MIEQTIEDIKFEDIILAKKQRQFRNTNKIRHFLEYLHMLDENKAFTKKNQVIKQCHSKFVFREDFWQTEVQRVLGDENNWNVEMFDWAFMAMEDGFYINVAKILSQKLVEALNAQKLRLNYVIAKLQILITQFDHCHLKGGAYFFKTLRDVYIKTGNVKKIRDTFKREISMGFDNYDVVYAEYINWEASQGNKQEPEHREMLEKAREYWQEMQIFNQEELPALEKSLEFTPNDQFKKDKRNIKRGLIHLENANAQRVNQAKYLTLLELLDSNAQKLWYLRRMALQQTHEMYQQYFSYLQLVQTDQELVINAFRNSFSWNLIESENIIKCEEIYLTYLIHQINKHLIEPQDEEYNNTWGSKVQFFRNQISELISKDRSSLKKQRQNQLILQYYNKWIDVEVALVKDSNAVQKIYENLLEFNNSSEQYANYASRMITLGDITKARWIYNKTCEKQNYQGRIVNDYRNFINIYGSIQEQIKLNQKIQEKEKNQFEKETKQRDDPKIKGIYQKQKQKVQHGNNSKTSSTNPKTVETVQEFQDPPINSPIHLYPQNHQIQPQKDQKTDFKRSSPTSASNEDLPQKEQQKKKKVHLDQQNTLFSSHVHKSWGQADIMLNIVFKQSVNEVRIVDKQKGKLCYIEFDSEQSAQKQLKANKSSLNLTLSRPPSKSDNTTLFLCNLPVKVTKNQIRDLVPQTQKQSIKDIRTKEKGDKVTAYIEFNDEQTKDEALNKMKAEKIKIGDRTIIALSCESDFRNKDKKYKTLFLKNLSFQCKEKDIREFFQKNGILNVAEVYFPRDEKTNKVRGLAYVELNENEDMEKALGVEKGILFGREFVITKSDRAITKHDNEKSKPLTKGERVQEKPEEKSQQKRKGQSKKSNNFFSSIFS